MSTSDDNGQVQPVDTSLSLNDAANTLTKNGTDSITGAMDAGIGAVGGMAGLAANTGISQAQNDLSQLSSLAQSLQS